MEFLPITLNYQLFNNYLFLTIRLVSSQGFCSTKKPRPTSFPSSQKQNRIEQISHLTNKPIWKVISYNLKHITSIQGPLRCCFLMADGHRRTDNDLMGSLTHPMDVTLFLRLTTPASRARHIYTHYIWVPLFLFTHNFCFDLRVFVSWVIILFHIIWPTAWWYRVYQN